MTVCLAAICMLDGKEAVIGASDCMLTYEDIEFEPPRSKIHNLNNKTFILFAGDVTEHTRIWRDAFLNKTTDPLTTTQIADAYAEAFQAFRMKKAEAKFLKPIGHTIKTYRSYKKGPYDFEITRKLEQSALELEVIIMGLDDSGGHIFTIEDPGVVICHDDISFCAVGIGASHARSSFMFARYTKTEDFIDCLYTMYGAKRRSEVAPGVGKLTVMAHVTDEHKARVVDDNHVRILKLAYDNTAESLQKTYNEFREMIHEQFRITKLF
jgi:20S proteasome alpha/beta subunit